MSRTSVAPLPLIPNAVQVGVVETDSDFDRRWNAWLARGLAHEHRARRRFLIWCPMVAIGAAVAFALFRS